MSSPVFRLHGGVTVAVENASGAGLASIRSALDPYEPTLDGNAAEAMVTLERAAAKNGPNVVEVQNPAGDALVTGAGADGQYYVRSRGRWCEIPADVERPRLVYEDGFPLGPIFRLAVRPAIQTAMSAQGAVAVHASAVEVAGRAVLVGGWSESGKTETALAFLERGALFLSDKWTTVTPEGMTGVFPISVGVRRWALEYLPRLRRALPRSARVQLGGAAVAAGLARPLQLGNPGRTRGLAADAVGRAVALANRAALSPTELRGAYGAPRDAPWTAQLGAVAVLTTVADGSRPVVVDASAEWAARKLARAAAFERRAFFDLYERSRFALPDRESPRGDSERRDERLLTAVLNGVRVLEVRAPFPTDPSAVAHAIEGVL